MSGTHTTRAVTDARIPDGRQHQKMTSWASMRYAVVDVEGNGQQPPDLVAVAVVPVAAGIIGAPASWLVKPPRPVSRIAARIHGLTNEALAAAPAFADIESEVREALDADVLVAHNAISDLHARHREVPVEIQLLKLTEETGEAAEAFIGMHGLNSRKGVCRSRDDLLAELADVIITAAVAMTGVTGGDVEEALSHLEQRLTVVTERARR